MSILSVIIHVILVQGPYAIITQEWDTIKEQTQAIYKRKLRRRPIKLKFTSPIYEKSSHTYTESNKVEAYYAWRDRLKAEKKKGIWLVVLPPYENNGSRYIGGYAKISCFKDINLSTVVVFLQAKNDRGEDRLLHSSYVVAHELAHAADAAHVPSITIMNEAPLPWVTQYGMLPFDIKSKREIKRCAARLRLAPSK